MAYMNHITINVENQTLTATPLYPLVAGSKGIVTFSVAFGSGWEELQKVIVFSTGSVQKQILFGATDEVPWEVLQDPGSLRITVNGTGDSERAPTARMRSPLKINSSGDTPEDPGYPASKEAWEQCLERAIAGKDGQTPTIGENGNWWIGTVDTGVNATGAHDRAEKASDEAEEYARQAKESADYSKQAADSILYMRIAPPVSDLVQSVIIPAPAVSDIVH